MDKASFLQGLTAFLRENYRCKDAKILKDRIKFKKDGFVYGELYFSYTANQNGYYVGYKAFNQEIYEFYERYKPPYREEIPSWDAQKLAMFAGSAESSHYYEPPLICQNARNGVIPLPQDEKEAARTYEDILGRLSADYFPAIFDVARMSERALHYLAIMPHNFRYKALTALYIAQKHGLPPNNAYLQEIAAFDERVRRNENGLFFPSNLIFGDNEFDRDIKREIYG
jgi:hypothetical protein